MKTDVRIKEDVLDELEWESSLDAADIGVSVEDGIVTLHGHVKTYIEKSEAEKAAKRIEGVRAVVLNIDVILAGSDKQTDEDLAKRALNYLEWNSKVPHEDITLKVDKGWITLSGEVEWQYQRVAAYNAVNKITGVRGITNSITIAATIQPKDIKEKIKKSFTRNAELDADGISVETVGHKVILSGTVRSLAEKKQAKRIAWLAPGVTAVDDNLEVIIKEEAY